MYYTGMTKTRVLLFAWGKQFLSAFPVCTLLSTLQALCLSTTISCIAIQELWNTNTMQTAKYKYKYKYNNKGEYGYKYKYRYKFRYEYKNTKLPSLVFLSHLTLHLKQL